jgi:uncharacterized protein (TIGR03067 family)
MSSMSLVLMVLSPLFVADEGSRETRGSSDLARFQGQWVVTFYEEAGVSLSRDITKDWQFTISGDSMKSTYTDGSMMSGRIRLDTSKSPREVDLIWKEGDSAEKPVLGIYEFEGDKLKICIGSKPESRPSRFASNRATGTGMMILEHPEKPSGEAKKDAGSR